MATEFKYQNEIVEALKSAEANLQRIKDQHDYLSNHVEMLKKSVECDHLFDKNKAGWTQTGCDKCSKCGWIHNY